MTLFDHRLARLRETMAATATDALFLGPSSHMLWLSGVSPHGDERPVLLVVTARHAGFLMPKLNADAARKATDLPFYAWDDAEGPLAAFDRLLADFALAGRSGLSVVLDETMRADFALLVLSRLPAARHAFTASTIGHLRAAKDETEYQLLKDNAAFNDRAALAAFDSLREGISEEDVADVVRDFYRAHGGAAEFTIICFGENAAFPHHHSGSRRLKRGDAVLVDIGGRVNGYPSDMTRMGYFGEEPQGFAQVAGIVETAVQAAIAAARPGVTARSVDDAARSVIRDAGYGDFFLHRTGHGLGIDIHEPPYITSTNDEILQVGNVFSIEPGIYLKDRFGIRLEEIVILRENGAEVLSGLPRRLIQRG